MSAPFSSVQRAQQSYKNNLCIQSIDVIWPLNQQGPV